MPQDPPPPRLCAPQIVRHTQIVRSAQIVRLAQIVRCAETEPPSTMMLSHFSGENPGLALYASFEYLLKKLSVWVSTLLTKGGKVLQSFSSVRIKAILLWKYIGFCAAKIVHYIWN